MHIGWGSTIVGSPIKRRPRILSLKYRIEVDLRNGIGKYDDRRVYRFDLFGLSCNCHHFIGVNRQSSRATIAARCIRRQSGAQSRISLFSFGHSRLSDLRSIEHRRPHLDHVSDLVSLGKRLLHLLDISLVVVLLHQHSSAVDYERRRRITNLILDSIPRIVCECIRVDGILSRCFRIGFSHNDLAVAPILGALNAITVSVPIARIISVSGFIGFIGLVRIIISAASKSRRQAFILHHRLYRLILFAFGAAFSVLIFGRNDSSRTIISVAFENISQAIPDGLVFRGILFLYVPEIKSIVFVNIAEIISIHNREAKQTRYKKYQGHNKSDYGHLVIHLISPLNANHVCSDRYDRTGSVLQRMLSDYYKLN